MSKRKEPTAISIRFTPSIRADGELVRVVISQLGQEIQLTLAQTESLVSELQARLQRRKE